MNNAFGELTKKITEGWKAAQRSQKILIIVVIILTIVAIAVVGSMATQVQYSVLYSGLTDSEAGAVMEELDSQGVEYRTRSGGTILVPKDQVNDLRYRINAEGVIQTGLSYDVYSDGLGFGATDKDRQMYTKMQLETNLSQMINDMDKIKSSAVLLSLAEETVYVLSDANKSQSSASVMVTLDTGATMTQEDAEAIRNLVSTSVKSLPPENITIVDSMMNVYTGGLSDVGTGVVNSQIDLQNKVAEQLKAQIVNLLSPVFGVEKLSASVNVILDFDKSVTNSITLEPPTDDAENMGIIVSMKTMQERIAGGTGAEGAPGLDENGGADIYQEIDALAGDSVYYQVTEEINAEVNEINEQLEKAQGTIKELSCTLIIDGGEELDELLPEVRTQIATAIGVAEENITVSSMPFEQNTLLHQALEEQTAAAELAERNDLIKQIILVGGIVGGIIIVLLLIMSSQKKKKQMELEAERLRILEEEERNRVDVAIDDEVSIEDLMEGASDSTLDQIQSLIKRNPDTVAQILRNWLLDEGR